MARFCAYTMQDGGAMPQHGIFKEIFDTLRPFNNNEKTSGLLQGAWLSVPYMPEPKLWPEIASILQEALYP